MKLQLVILVPLLGLIACQDVPISSNNLTTCLVRSSNAVSNDVYKILGKNEQNLLFCPLSYNILLTLVTLGGKGKTIEELKKALHLNIENDDIKLGYEQLLEDLRDDKLKLATRIFSRQGLTLVPEFLATAQKYFHTDIQPTNFSAPLDAARVINSFVAEKTDNKIIDLVGSLDPESSVVLVNAAHFKDTWENIFQKTFTSDFHLSKDQSTKTEMMQNSGYYKFQESAVLDAMLLVLPFQTRQYSMVVILPNKIEGLGDAERSLYSTDLESLMNNLTETEVEVMLPKFKIESEIDLERVSKELGVEALFSPQADLSGMIKEPVPVTGVIQKSFLNVDEYGVEAAAATATVSNRAPERFFNPKKFVADHPFIFFIMKDNLILFQGRLSKM